jgi:Arc/MetJ-type ribon-helix-helix transcriptional regulator
VARKKIRISADLEVLTRIDILVRERKFRSRSEFFNIALAEKLSLHSEHSLAIECEKLDPTEEQELAEIGLHSDLIIFPKYLKGACLASFRMGGYSNSSRLYVSCLFPS